MQKILITLLSISLLLLHCNGKDNKKKQLMLAGTVLLLTSPANGGVEYTTGLTIRIPDGIPLKSSLSASNSIQNNSILKFFKSVGFVGEAKALENEWAFVRQSALWANNNSDTIEAIIGPIKKYNLLSSSGTFQTVVETPKGGLFIVKLTVNANASVLSSAYSGTLVFKHKFEMWRQSDNVKALEMFFDSADQLTDKGILLLYNLNVLDPAAFPDSLICETYASIKSASYLGNTVSSQKQTISWSGSQVFYSGADKGRVVLEKMDNDTILCFKSVVRFPNNPSVFPSQCGTNTKYYSLAYSQFLTTPKKEATAMLSLMDNGIDNTNAQLCGLITRNYGLFENSGFLEDTVAAASVPPTYPEVQRVDKLFGAIGTVGAGVWDDLSKAKLDTINISFHSTASP